MNKRKTGAVYEQKAAEYLEKAGCRILEMNYRCRAGEIDIVARDGRYVVFCEVKYRSGYLAEHRLQDVPCRFDVIGIEGGEITHIKDAFAG